MSESIDRLRDAGGRLDREAILAILPYGDGFLFIDRVDTLTPKKIEATFPIPLRAPFLDGHFEGLPIVPGAILSEAFAQAGSLLVRYHLDHPRGVDILGHHVESARFLSPVVPGDVIHLEVNLLNVSRRAARIAGEARVGQRRVGKMSMVVAVVPREALQRQLKDLKQLPD